MKRRRGDASEGGEVVAAMDGSTCHVARVTPGGHTRVRMPSETSQRPRDCRSDSDEKRRGEERREEEWREEKWREEEWREEEWREEEWRAQFAHREGAGAHPMTSRPSSCSLSPPRQPQAEGENGWEGSARQQACGGEGAGRAAAGGGEGDHAGRDAQRRLRDGDGDSPGRAQAAVRLADGAADSLAMGGEGDAGGHGGACACRFCSWQFDSDDDCDLLRPCTATDPPRFRPQTVGGGAEAPGERGVGGEALGGDRGGRRAEGGGEAARMDAEKTTGACGRVEGEFTLQGDSWGATGSAWCWQVGMGAAWCWTQPHCRSGRPSLRHPACVWVCRRRATCCPCHRTTA
ncbi:hypothetical protein CLOM_g844 [Closterium sp. NIES-68]|nr:hypothetical protein CLOM_g844 [Closterium sp. NIES-68]